MRIVWQYCGGICDNKFVSASRCTSLLPAHFSRSFQVCRAQHWAEGNFLRSYSTCIYVSTCSRHISLLAFATVCDSYSSFLPSSLQLSKLRKKVMPADRILVVKVILGRKNRSLSDICVSLAIISSLYGADMIILNLNIDFSAHSAGQRADTSASIAPIKHLSSTVNIQFMPHNWPV